MKLTISTQEMEEMLIKEDIIPRGYRLCGAGRTTVGFNIYLEKIFKKTKEKDEP